VTSDYELLLVITLSETRFITRISSEPVPYFHVPHRLTDDELTSTGKSPDPQSFDGNPEELELFCKTVGYVKVRHRFRRYSSDETCLA
jgi:hypothetical protein